MSQDIAVKTAQDAFRHWMHTGEKAYGITRRYLDGRFDVYSLDVGDWHILLSDNGARLICTADCSRV